MAVPSLRFCIVFYTYWAYISLATCLCGSAHVHILHCVSHVLKQYQVSKLPLWECPRSYFIFRFMCVKAMSAYRVASVRVPTFMFCIVFYMHSGNSRLPRCFCGSAHVHVLHCVLHAVRQPQAGELLLCRCPRSCFVLCLKRIEPISVQQLASVGVPTSIFCIALYMY